MNLRILLNSIFFVLILSFLLACKKNEDNTSCGASRGLNRKFDGGFVAIPNAFTPDRDSVDEAFGPISHNIKSFELKIMDDEGKEIFKSTDQNSWWDGAIDGSVRTGLYKYTYHGVTIKDEVIDHSGEVCVITKDKIRSVCYKNFDQLDFTSLYNNGEFSHSEKYKLKYSECK